MAVGARTIKLTVDASGPYTISIHGAFWPEPRSDEVFGNDSRMRGISFYESVVAPVSLITYLCSALALKIGQAAFDRFQFIQEIHDDWGDLVPGDL